MVRRVAVLTLYELINLARSLALTVACGIITSPLRLKGVQPPQFTTVAIVLVGFATVTYVYDEIKEAKKRKKTRRDRAIIL